VRDLLAAEMMLWKLAYLCAILAMLILGSAGCAHTTVEYVDPDRPMATVRVQRTTFFRHGRVDIQFPIATDVRIVDEPMGDNLATTAIIGASIAGAIAGPAGAAAVLGGATLLGVVTAIQRSDQPVQAEQDAPPLRPSEKPSVLPPTAQWNQFTCGGVMEPEWCR
jgi:hypothetical protein